MSKLDELLDMWSNDSNIDKTEPGRELINIPKLHSKYLNILSKHRLLMKQAEVNYIRLRKVKWEYYTGKMDQTELKKYGWEPFPYVLKSEVNTYLESDDDLVKLQATKAVHEEIVECCQSILKELNNRTWQLRDLITWERFIQGA